MSVSKPRGRFVTSLAELRRAGDRCVLLFSGGLDSTYLFASALDSGIDVVPLRVDLSGTRTPPPAEDLACSFGVAVTSDDGLGRFVEDYVTRGIKANCMYQGTFPISSSLSRPFMAQVAVEVARSVGAGAVVHSADFHQNSCARFNNAVRALAPDLVVANPLLEDELTRRARMHALADQIALPKSSIYSVDENVWARVIENGELDDIATPVPESVFAWTKKAASVTPCDETTIRVRFERGLPVAIDGREIPLTELLIQLNELAGGYGIGRFNGCEETRFGVKNHEVREAPAAAVILTAHRHLEQLVLTDDELAFKRSVDDLWTRSAVTGDWFSPLREALSAFEDRMAELVRGTVQVTLGPGNAFVSAISAPAGLGATGHPAMRGGKPVGGYSFEKAFDFETGHQLARSYGPEALEERSLP